MKNTTENIKPEHIFLNLANCSEKEQIEVIAMLPQPQDSDDYDIIYDYKYLIFDDDIERNCWWVVDETRISNKTEVNLQQFKQIIEWKEVLQVDIFDIDFGGNVMARMEIKDGKFRFTNAMNGGGYPIAIEDIKITPTN